MNAREIHEAREVLDSWKEISVYLGRDVRTCRRWEERLGLPIHRLNGSPKARVRAYKDEVDRWLEKKLHEREGHAFSASPSLSFLRRWPIIAALVALLAIAAVAFFRKNNGRPHYVPGPRPPAIAVLPFVNGTGDKGLDYLRESLPGHIIRDLQKSADHMTVLSLDAAVGAVRRIELEPGQPLTPDDLAAIGTSTDADWFLTGYISSRGSKLDVDYVLRDLASLGDSSGAPSSAPLKTASVRGTEAQVPDIAERVAHGVRRAFGVPTQVAPEALSGCTLQATRFYEMARSVERKYTLSLDAAELAQMIDYMEKARKEDPGCPLACLGLGDAYQHRFAYEGHDPEALRLMKDFYKLAYAMAPERAETNCGVGWIHFFEGDNDQAYAFFKKALSIDPASLHVLFEVGSFLRSIGLLEKASDYYSRVIRAGGSTADVYFLRGWTYEHMGFYESALADFDRMVKLEPLDWRSRCLRARVLILMKRYEAAASELSMAESMDPDMTFLAMLRALVAAANGEREEALAALAPKGFKAGPGRGAVTRSRVYAALGMPDEALAAIEQGIAHGFEDVYDYLFFFPFLNNTRDHFYDGLRGDPRFAEILRRMEHAYVDSLNKYSDL